MTSGWKVGYRMRAVDTLRCARCDEPKPIASFRVLAHGGRASYCGPCQNECTKAWRRNNLERINLARRAAYVHVTNLVARSCSICGAPFEAPHPSYLRCPAHRSPKRPVKVQGPVDRGLPAPLADPGNDIHTHNAEGTR
jgi:hypothetical protein